MRKIPRWHALCIRSFRTTKPNQMKNMTSQTQAKESTYALLVRSEKEERSVPEAAVYLLLILSTVLSVWQLALQPFTVPANGIQSAPIARVAEPKPERV